MIKIVLLALIVVLMIKIALDILAFGVSLVSEIVFDVAKPIYLKGFFSRIFSCALSAILSLPLMILTPIIALLAVIFSIFIAFFEFMFKTPTTRQNWLIKLLIVFTVLSFLF